MEIRIRRTGVSETRGDPGAFDITDTYAVVDNGREFTLTFRSTRHGSSLGIAGEQGTLYTDRDEGTVRRHVLALGRDCGIRVESDEVVDGLSPWSLRGVMILARHCSGAQEIVVAADNAHGGSGMPTVYVDGAISDLHRFL